MHVWLYEYGHRADEKQFNEEDICEIVASSNDFINEVVNKYSKAEDEIIIHGIDGTVIRQVLLKDEDKDKQSG